MPAPLSVIEIVPPERAPPALASRWVNLLLLVPVTGAFLQLAIFHQLPSLAWVLLVLVVAGAASWLNTRARIRQRPARLARDGVALGDRFVSVPEIAKVERERETVRIELRTGERIELRAPKAKLLVAELKRTIAEQRTEREEDLVAEIASMNVSDRRGPYRGRNDEVTRCLAIAEDAGAPTRARIAAAQRLHQHEDADVRVRIAVVVAESACTELREIPLASQMEDAARQRR